MSDRFSSRKVTEASELKALTHPVRLALLDVLALHDELTATAAGDLIGESATTCSFHFRQLESFGFVERAGEPGRRAQPWRMTSAALHVPVGSDSDPQGEYAQALSEQLIHHHVRQVRRWELDRSTWDQSWQDAADQSQYLLWVTAEELREVVDHVREILAGYRDRLTDPTRRPAGARPAQFLTFAHPLPSASDDDGTG